MTMNKIASTSLALALFLPLSVAAQTQGRAHGVVSDPDGQPIAGVKVEVLDPGRSNAVAADTETNEKGSYSVVVVDATRPYIFRLTKEGYQPIEEEVKIPTGGNENFDWMLAPATARRTQPAPPTAEGEQPQPEPLQEGEIAMNAKAAEAYNAAVEAIQAGDKATAKPKFEEAVAIDPNIAPAWAVLGAISLEDGDFPKALEQADKALAIEPENTIALQVKYKAHEAMGDTEAAAAARDALIKVSPESGADALLADGNAAFNAGNMDTAIAKLEQALAAKPDLFKAHYTLGMAYANKEDNAKAVEHLKAFLEAAPADDPDVPLAQEMLAYVEGGS